MELNRWCGQTVGQRYLQSSIIVTGSNIGIGQETTRVLVALGGCVILACRKEEKANVATRDMELTNASKDKLTCIPVDLSLMDTIHDFALIYHQKKEELMWQPLRTLVLSSGIFLPDGQCKTAVSRVPPITYEIICRLCYCFQLWAKVRALVLLW